MSGVSYFDSYLLVLRDFFFFFVIAAHEVLKEEIILALDSKASVFSETKL